MYGDPIATDYDNTHKNSNSSIAKNVNDEFYNLYLSNFKDYFADTLFCGDKTLANSTIGTDNLVTGVGTDKTYYAATERLYYSEGTTMLETLNPTLECAKGATNTYARYTINPYTTEKGVETNGDLTNPIGLLSADEVILSGTHINNSNNLNYLGINRSSTWTMTPFTVINGNARMFNFHSKLNTLAINIASGQSRPVINIKSTILVTSGDGTEYSPYTITLN